jgi:hypothetical protein
MTPGTLYLLNRRYHWSILNKIHAYIYNPSDQGMAVSVRTLMNVVIATQTADR